MGNEASTPLHKAADEKDFAKVQWEVQQRPSSINVRESKMGWTPLHIAAFRGSDPIVRELLARGAQHDIEDKDGRTPLHLAALYGCTEVVRDLVRAGASGAVRDKAGAAPYDYAVQKHPGIAAMLGKPPPPPPPSASGGPSQPPPPPAAAAATGYTRDASDGGFPTVDFRTVSASQVLPPPPPSAPPGSMGVGGLALPRVYHHRTPPEELFPPPPVTTPSAPYPAGPSAMQWPQAQPPPSQWPAVQQPHRSRNDSFLPYPSIPGRQQPHQPAPEFATAGVPGPPTGPMWPGGGGGGVRVTQPSYGQTPQGPPPVVPAAHPRTAPHKPAGAWPVGGLGGETGGGGRGSGPAGGAVQGDPDLGWGPEPRMDWGGERDCPSPPPPVRNAILSARYQLNRLLGMGLSQLGLGGGGGSNSGANSGGGATNPRVDHAGGGGSAGSSSGGSTLATALGGSVAAARGGRRYSYEQLSAATGRFSAANMLGQGGYGPVYRGQLDGIPVAVKVMDASVGSLQGRGEFEAKVAILSSLHHPHVVLLIGSCPEKGILVYELMSNGSLETHLLQPDSTTACGGGRSPSPAPLGWRDRVRIACEVAAALLFLHSGERPIVHMDLKPANILLNDHLTAKLGDVGLAQLAPTLDRPAGPAGAAVAAAAAAAAQVGRPVAPPQDDLLVGTYQYMDPAYLATGAFGPASDVFALGLVMMQLLTGRQGAARAAAEVVAARRQQPPTHFSAVLDPAAGSWPAAEALAFADLALDCVAQQPRDRPDLRTKILPTLQQLKQRTILYDMSPTAGANPHQQQPQLSAPEEDVQSLYICPLTLDVMDDPVVAPDGYTYERLAITEWLARSRTSPLTNMALSSTALTENRTLRSAIREWRDRRERQQRQGAAVGAVGGVGAGALWGSQAEAGGPRGPVHGGEGQPVAGAAPPVYGQARRVVVHDDDGGW